MVSCTLSRERHCCFNDRTAKVSVLALPRKINEHNLQSLGLSCNFLAENLEKLKDFVYFVLDIVFNFYAREQ